MEVQHWSSLGAVSPHGRAPRARESPAWWLSSRAMGCEAPPQEGHPTRRKGQDCSLHVLRLRLRGAEEGTLKGRVPRHHLSLTHTGGGECNGPTPAGAPRVLLPARCRACHRRTPRGGGQNALRAARHLARQRGRRASRTQVRPGLLQLVGRRAVPDQRRFPVWSLGSTPGIVIGVGGRQTKRIPPSISTDWPVM